MTPGDIKVIHDMKNRITYYKDKDRVPVNLINTFITLREMLESRDDEWEKDLNYHLITLDSASSFVPKNDEENIYHLSVIKFAVDEIIRLVEDKLAN